MFGSPLYTVPAGVETRWASPENFEGAKGAGGMARAGRKGSAKFSLGRGEERVLARVERGSGVVRRIWMTLSDFSKETLRGVTLQFFWDGAASPAASVPLGDFFGMCIGRMAPFKSALFSSAEGRSLQCFIPMPFRNGMEIIVKNEKGADIKQFYYDIDYTLGDALGEDALYFHAWFGRENPTTRGRDYHILPPVQGRGRFLGVNVGVRCDTARYFVSWWGEGEMKMYLDGDEAFPTLCGTGCEDYIGTAWGQDYFYDLYSGSQIYDKDKMELAFYRYHIPDPIYFHHSIRVDIQQIGAVDPPFTEQRAVLHLKRTLEGYSYPAADGSGELDFMHPAENADGSRGLPMLFERQDDWSSCAYFYLDKAENGLPLLAVEARMI